MSQSQTILSAMERPQKYIGHAHYLQTIYDAIYTDDKLCRVVLIKGSGGLGKTRLLEEIMSRLGHRDMRRIYPYVAEDWSEQQPRKAIVSDMFDFINIHLHTRNNFLTELGNQMRWGKDSQIRFGNFNIANLKLKRKLEAGTSFSTLDEANREMLEAFWKDYQNAIPSRRLVIPLDTAEQFVHLSSQWLKQNNLLSPVDLATNTEQWLIDHIKAGKFENTTFLIAGRADEGKAFFEEIEAALQKSQGLCHYEIIEAKPLGIEEIKLFCLALAEDGERSGEKDLAQAFRELAEDDEQLAVLELFTEGQPVRLSLYTDVLLEGQTIPTPLLLSKEEAEQIASNPIQLKQAQQQIEQEFVNLLFRRLSLRSQILQALARATRGLNAGQLHYILYSDQKDGAAIWNDLLKQFESKRKERDDVLHTLESLARLSIVKIKNRYETDPLRIRYGLQDEVYRIYATCMKDNDLSYQAEIQERLNLYGKIIDWLKPQRKEIQEKLQKIRAHQIEQIYIERYDNILSTHMKLMNRPEEDEQSKLSNVQLELDLEYLHYQLLLNPYEHFNDTYFNLGYNKNTAKDLVAGALFQSELTRTLYEEYTVDFINWNIGPDRESFDSHPKTIQRMIQQHDAARWILFFTMHGQAGRAIQLAEEIEKTIANITDADVRQSWQKVEAIAERACWKAYAYALKDDYDEAINLVRDYIPSLRTLTKLDYKPHEQIFGYRGTPQQKRLIFLMAHMYNTEGYCYAQMGKFRASVTAYTAAQRRLRYTGSFRAQLATVLNNQSRPLAEMGLKRSERIALDALQLRLEEGALIPIVLSYNTLGLIYNLFYRPQQAIEACARAYAIAKEVGDERTLGLVHVQLAIGLRRLVRQNQAKYQFSRESDQIYQQADTALQRALELFHRLANGRSSSRLIETYIELGCLHRDWLHFLDPNSDDAYQYYQNAKSYLQDAINMAHDIKLDRLILDAQVNLAQTHFEGEAPDKCQRALADTKVTVRRIAPTAFFEKGKEPPQPNEEIEHYLPYYIFQQLSKIESLRGRIGMEQFLKFVELLKETPPTNGRKQELLVHRNKHLKDAVRAFAFASSYAEIFASNSHVLTNVYDTLYDYIKKFNPAEMVLYYRYDKEVREQYLLNEVKPVDLGDTRSFLIDSFGDYYDTVEELEGEKEV